MRTSSPARLAGEVLRRLDLAEQLGIVDLYGRPRIENSDSGVSSLCIPALTLQDGPNGLGNGDTGVTQLPSALSVAATFDPTYAYREGAVEGAEARGQGIDAVQGPVLNLVRVPEFGRAAETYGEDPTLASLMGVADIEGIQSQKVMSDAKHFTAYTQESGRHTLDQVIGNRALEEVYLAPFRAAVTQAHVASIMCAYGKINGVADCADPALYRVLQSWHFGGFVRSDLGAAKSATAAFAAGLDAIKPAAGPRLWAAVQHHQLGAGAIAGSAERILTEMFRFGLVAHPLPLRPGAKVATRAHAAVALAVAEASIVLMKNERRLLPLDFASLHSVAVIGDDAGANAMTTPYGGAHVVAPFVSHPLQAISAIVRHGHVSYASGGSEVGGTSPIPLAEAPLVAVGSGAGGVSQSVIPNGDRRHLVYEIRNVRPPASGLYVVSLRDNGPAWLLLDGHEIFATPAQHAPMTWSQGMPLQAGRDYRLQLVFQPQPSSPQPVLAWRDATPQIAAAVKAASRAQVAIVFASDYSSEGMDRPDLSLPGDENQLISAVAKANPRTVVVLNTSGAVLMPWLSKVAAVLEAWYPGEEDGNATAAVLSGAYDPTGRLPVTFPASEGAVAAHTQASWPGIGGTVVFSEGLDIGYRWDQAHRVTPLFPFGFGLSYTRFALSDLRLSRSGGGYRATLEVADTGTRRGSEVVQAYLRFPPAAGEPPWQLRAVARVTLDPGTRATAVLELPASGFRCYLGGRWRVVGGRYELGVGTSSAELPFRAGIRLP